MRNIRGTCSSVELLKRYMVRERLGNPALEIVVERFSAQEMFKMSRGKRLVTFLSTSELSALDGWTQNCFYAFHVNAFCFVLCDWN